jgi:TetR/AcrR family transcriptional regulator, cholesterol catabolism regulator
MKNAKLIDQRRKQIIEGPIKVFIAKDFHSVTVREIVEESDLTMGSLYCYLKNDKRLLFKEIFWE